ncbi:uncharacterized protein E0L32_001650 [Thyridium curvatum]|uniref:Uncharacterized protein n=1 Tax=Thyridium curvatum TaxID=1093900 RepID=A0A507AW86_9PEZI|nr:uncharacterized protein E0L32_001548 [Thyridium curvatum]XP_030990901.1 uncharacterized protein E0L32_001650 [Thyridium curvatum]TPX09088.1 hypothetical protein E0L32_001548 [Thyridium curvatum]TPX09190.1 hypothetical protein E0L32_001650 [Thyridium curvatum]
MTRTLPWKRRGASNPVAVKRESNASPSSSRGRSPIKRDPGRPSPTPKRERDLSRDDKKPRSNLSLKRSAHSSSSEPPDWLTNSSPDRTPSTSPPPAPPTESLMIEGADNDDKYRMVEDELLATAKMFTAHLHNAEYQRLKKLAKSQNAETIKNISRPVTGNMTDLVRRRQTTLSRTARQRAGIKRARARVNDGDGDSDDDEGDAAFAGTALQGLMASPRKTAVPLTALTSVAGGTRAAAGLAGNSPSRRSRFGPGAWDKTGTAGATESATASSGDDGDDLDGVTTFDPYKQSHQSRPPIRPARPAGRSTENHRGPSNTPTTFQDRRTVIQTHPPEPQADEEEDFGGFGAEDIMRRARERRERDRARRAGRGAREKKAKDEKDSFKDVVPSWI